MLLGTDVRSAIQHPKRILLDTDFRSAIQRTKWILFVSLLVQLCFCVTQVGYFHADQHFQIIEFSSWQLHTPSGATSVWELKSQIRPTIQVYLFSAFTELCQLLGIGDAYAQLTILRIIFGLLGLILFNILGISCFKTNRKVLYPVLLLINFSWILPYTRTLFSSEMVSALLFFIALLLYEIKRENKIYLFVVGLLFAVAFFLRFQMLFGMIGFGLWLLLIEKKYNYIAPLVLGFLVGVGINIFLDYNFYHEFVFTPYSYYHVNITEGKAAEFGTSSFMYYVVMLLIVIGTPLFSVFLFLCALSGMVKQYRQPLVFIILFFVLGHCLVAHKEERFLFPILNVLPILAAWGLEPFIAYYSRARGGIRALINVPLYFSILLTMATLLALALHPISQTIEFSRKLTDKFKDETPTVYCYVRTPFETVSGLPLTFYRRNTPNIRLVKFQEIDSVRHIKNMWLTTTYNDAKGKTALLDSLGFKPQLYSSAQLWGINQFLESQKINTINDVWVLYKREL